MYEVFTASPMRQSMGNCCNGSCSHVTPQEAAEAHGTWAEARIVVGHGGEWEIDAEPCRRPKLGLCLTAPQPAPAQCPNGHLWPLADGLNCPVCLCPVAEHGAD